MVTTSTATGSAAPPKKPNSGTSGSARATAAAAEARKPARVMPIWMVDRNWLGSRASWATSRPVPPSCSRRRSWPARSEIRATSLPAKAALTTTRSRTSPISTHGVCIPDPPFQLWLRGQDHVLATVPVQQRSAEDLRDLEPVKGAGAGHVAAEAVVAAELGEQPPEPGRARQHLHEHRRPAGAQVLAAGRQQGVLLALHVQLEQVDPGEQGAHVDRRDR